MGDVYAYELVQEQAEEHKRLHGPWRAWYATRPEQVAAHGPFPQFWQDLARWPAYRAAFREYNRSLEAKASGHAYEPPAEEAAAPAPAAEGGAADAAATAAAAAPRKRQRWEQLPDASGPAPAAEGAAAPRAAGRRSRWAESVEGAEGGEGGGGAPAPPPAASLGLVLAHAAASLGLVLAHAEAEYLSFMAGLGDDSAKQRLGVLASMGGGGGGSGGGAPPAPPAPHLEPPNGDPAGIVYAYWDVENPGGNPEANCSFFAHVRVLREQLRGFGVMGERDELRVVAAVNIFQNPRAAQESAIPSAALARTYRTAWAGRVEVLAAPPVLDGADSSLAARMRADVRAARVFDPTLERLRAVVFMSDDNFVAAEIAALKQRLLPPGRPAAADDDGGNADGLQLRRKLGRPAIVTFVGRSPSRAIAAACPDVVASWTDVRREVNKRALLMRQRQQRLFAPPAAPAPAAPRPAAAPVKKLALRKESTPRALQLDPADAAWLSKVHAELLARKQKRPPHVLVSSLFSIVGIKPSQKPLSLLEHDRQGRFSVVVPGGARQAALVSASAAPAPSPLADELPAAFVEWLGIVEAELRANGNQPLALSDAAARFAGSDLVNLDVMKLSELIYQAEDEGRTALVCDMVELGHYALQLSGQEAPAPPAPPAPAPARAPAPAPRLTAWEQDACASWLENVVQWLGGEPVLLSAVEAHWPRPAGVPSICGGVPLSYASLLQRDPRVELARHPATGEHCVRVAPCPSATDASKQWVNAMVKWLEGKSGGGWTTLPHLGTFCPRPPVGKLPLVGKLKQLLAQDPRVVLREVRKKKCWEVRLALPAVPAAGVAAAPGTFAPAGGGGGGDTAN
jgi:hypothetical protein